MPDWAIFLILCVVIFGGVGVMIYLLVQYDKKRTEAFKAYAENNGYSFVEMEASYAESKDESSVIKQFEVLQSMNTEIFRGVDNLIRKQFDDFELCIFDHTTYGKTRGGGKTGGHGVDRDDGEIGSQPGDIRETFMCFDFKNAHFPKFDISNRYKFFTLSRYMSNQSFDTMHSAFDEQYTVCHDSGADTDAIKALLPDEFCELILKEKHLYLECGDDKIMICINRRRTPLKRFEEFVDYAIDLARRLHKAASA